MEKSIVIQMMDLAWRKNRTKSWIRLNTALWDYLKSIIDLGVEFEQADWEHILKSYDIWHWMGKSLNGLHMGEGLYRHACMYNKSAALSYEHANKRTPFLLKSLRVYEDFEFKWAGKYWHVTGWRKENDSINVVGYENRRKEGKRTLMSFEKATWKEQSSNFEAL